MRINDDVHDYVPFTKMVENTGRNTEGIAPISIFESQSHIPSIASCIIDLVQLARST